MEQPGDPHHLLLRSQEKPVIGHISKWHPLLSFIAARSARWRDPAVTRFLSCQRATTHLTFRKQPNIVYSTYPIDTTFSLDISPQRGYHYNRAQLNRFMNVKELIDDYRKKINPPYTSGDFVTIGLTILVILSLSSISFLKKQSPAEEKPQVQGATTTAKTTPGYDKAMLRLGFHRLKPDEYVLTKKLLGKATGPKKRTGERTVFVSLKDGFQISEKTDQRLEMSVIDGNQASAVYVAKNVLNTHTSVHSRNENKKTSSLNPKNSIVLGTQTTNTITQSPPAWQISSDPTTKTNSISQTFTVNSTDRNITNAVVSFNLNVPGITINSNKTNLNLPQNTSDSFTATLTIDNDQAKTGSYSGQIVYTSNGAPVGSTPISVVINPSFTSSPVSVDFGVDDPGLSTWTPTVQTITITNLRKDVTQTVSISPTSLPTGANITITPASSTTIAPGGSFSLSSQLSVNNSQVGNGVYTGSLVITNPNASTSLSVPVQFTKFYVLVIQDIGGTGFENSWVTSTGKPVIILGGGPKAQAYLSSPGTYNVVFKYPNGQCNVSCYADYWVFKEGINVSQGITTVTASRTDAKNRVIENPTAANGQSGYLYIWITMSGERLHYLPNGDDLYFHSWWNDDAMDDGLLTSYYSNISNNFSLEKGYNQGGYDPVGTTQVFYYNATNLSSGKTITNTTSDFQKIPVYYSPDSSLTVFAAITPCLSGYCWGDSPYSTYNPFCSPTITIPGQQTLATLVPPQAGSYYASYLRAQSGQINCYGTGNLTWGPEVSPMFTADSSPKRWFASFLAGSARPPQGNAINALPAMQERVVYNGLGPSYWSGTFQNSQNQIKILPYYSLVNAMFLRQDFSIKDYGTSGQITYTIPTAGGGVTTVNGGSFPSYSSFVTTNQTLAPVSLPVAGPAKMTATFPYMNLGRSLNSKTIASFDTSKADPNPPAFKRLYYYANNARSEVYDPAVNGNYVQFEMDPVGGTMGSITVQYAVDGKTFQPISVSNTNGVFTAIMPSGLSSGSNIVDIDIRASDDTGNILDYDFQMPFGIAPNPIVSPTPTIVSTPLPTPTPSPSPNDTTAPTLTITNPQNGFSLPNKGTIQIQTTASDQSGIAWIKLFINTALVKTCTATTMCQYNWSMSKLTSGNYTITTTAADNATNQNTTSVSITGTKP